VITRNANDLAEVDRLDQRLLGKPDGQVGSKRLVGERQLTGIEPSMPAFRR